MSTDLSMIHWVIIIPFLAAVIIPFINNRRSRIHVGWFVLIVPIILLISLLRYVPTIARGDTYTYTFAWIPSFGIQFTTYLDGLSMIFGLLITGIGSLVVLYSIYYLSPKESLQHFYIYLLLFMGSMLGVVFSDHMMVLYVFWELTSISSFLLIAFWFHRKKSRYGALKSLLITVSGGMAMLVSFIMIFVMTETFSIREVVTTFGQYSDHVLFAPAMILLLLGAFTKSSQFPFHIWLPDAMEAPTPVSAYLHSATMVKAGIYLVARFTPFFGGEELWFWLVSGIGLTTLFWGAFQAIRQTDLKALLAYSTISQLGLIMSLFGMGSVALYLGASPQSVLYTQAIFAALFHLVNHSTFKGALFMIVGIVDLQIGTRDIRRLGGLMAFMPVSFTVALMGSFSMAGLPPFNGFLSKEMFFTAALSVKELAIFSLETWGILFPIIAWIASVFTFVYSMIIVFKTFLGTYRGETIAKKDIEPPVGMLIPPVILALFIIGIFFTPNQVGHYLIQPAMLSVFPSFSSQSHLLEHTISAWHGWTPEVWMTLGIIGVGGLLYALLRHWQRIYRIFPETWSLHTVYNKTISGLETGASMFTKWYMTGDLRDYMKYIYLFFIVTTGGIVLYTGALSFDMTEDAPVAVYEWIFVLIMMVAGVAMLFAKSRVTATLLNGVLGFSIAFFFVLFRAPDLALTQTVIETVTTALFLLSFYFLPKWTPEKTPRRTKMVNICISIAVGLIFIAVGLSAKSGQLFETISTYFENAYEFSGGKNIVNAILGDFRAFDTMLEVIVLFIGGLGVYTLVKHRQKKGDENHENQ